MTSTRRVVLTGAGTAVVVALLFGYDTSTSGPTPPTPQSAVISGGTASAGSSPSSLSSPTSSASTTSSSAPAAPSKRPATSTATGAVAQTQWGPVQVRLTATGARVTKVDVVQYPQGNGNDAQINSYALPILIQETIKSQSAHIDMVSGATVTSTGYLQSLQSALDQLHA